MIQNNSIEIITQMALGAAGLVYTYGVVVNGHPKRIFYCKEELINYLRCFYGS